MIKQLILMALFLAATIGCKKDKADPIAKIEGIVGRWRATEIEELQNGNMVWQPVGNAWFINFLTDGTVVDNNGNLTCCPPEILTIDGITVKLASATYSCSSVRCGGCLNWGIEQHGNEIIITICNSSRVKYMRD